MANAAAFDPDAYLAASTPAPAAGGFDPDAYLAATSAKPPAEKPGVLSRIGAAIGGALTGTAEMAGLGAPVEMFEYGVMGREPARHMPVAGPFGATESQVREVERQAGETRKAVQQAGGVAPFVVQNVTQPFQKIGEAFTAPPQTLGQAYDVGKAVPQAAATLEAGYGGLKSIGGAAARGAEKISAAMPARPVAQIVKDAREIGYLLKPSRAGGKVGSVVEGMTSSPRLSIEATVGNQKNTNRLVNQDLGLPKDTVLTPAKMTEIRRPHNAVYAEVGKLGPIATDQQYLTDIQNIGRTPGTSFQKVRNPDLEALREAYTEQGFDSQDAVLQIRKLRNDARKNIKNPDPAKNEVGYAQRQIADAIENQIERHAQGIGQGDLVDRFRNARKELAIINTAQDALIASTGDISASRLARAKAKGAPLSGNLAKIAEVHDAFPSEMRDVAKVRNQVPVTALEGVAGGAGAVAAAATHNPLAAAGVLGAVTGRPLARKFLLSDLYQSRLAPGPKTPRAKPPTLKDRPVRKAAKAVGRSQYLTIPITKGQQDLQEQPQ
jgi:hypothetical protein